MPAPHPLPTRGHPRGPNPLPGRPPAPLPPPRRPPGRHGSDGPAPTPRTPPPRKTILKRSVADWGGVNSGPTCVPYQTEMRPNSGQPRGDLAARLTRSSRHTKQKRAQTTRAARKTKETQARNTSRASNQRRIDGQPAPPKSHEKLHVTKRQTHDTVHIRKEGESGHGAHFHRQTHAHIRTCKYVKPGTHRHRA